MEVIHSIVEDRDVEIDNQVCPTVVMAIRDQERLGKALLLRGFLSNKWRIAMEKYTKVRVDSKISLLVTVLWKKLYFSVWNQRNALLHKDGCMVHKRETELLERTLCEVREKHQEMINYTQYQLVDYTDDQIGRWNIDTKREMVSVLVAVRISYAELLKTGEQKQSLITDYWK